MSKRPIRFEDIYDSESEIFGSLNFKILAGKTILITGCRGMLGGTLAVTFIELKKRNQLPGSKVYLASREWGNWQYNLENATDVIFITNQEARETRLNFDLIIHCASPSNITKISNLENLLDINQTFLSDCVSNRTEKIIFISAGEVYGGQDTTLVPRIEGFNKSEKRSWYPLAKLQTEGYLTKNFSQTDVSINILRLFHSFGPGLSKDDGRSFADFLYSGAASEDIVLKSHGDQIRTFLYSGDAVAAILLTILSAEKFLILNIGSESRFSIREFAQEVARISNVHVATTLDGSFLHSPFNSVVPNISRARQLGWAPKVEMQEAIKRTLKWIKN